MEAKQKVPPFLLELCSENEKYLNLGGERELIVDNLSSLDQCLFSFLNFCICTDLTSKYTYYVCKTSSFYICLVLLQMNVVAAIAAGSDTELRNVQNWRLCRINKRQILGVAIIWLAMRRTIKFLFK